MGAKELSDGVSRDGASSRKEGFARDWCHLRAKLLSCDIWPSAALSVAPLEGAIWLITDREKIACEASLTAATVKKSGSTALFICQAASFARLVSLNRWCIQWVGSKASHHLRLSTSKPKQLVMDRNELNRRGYFQICRAKPTDSIFSFSTYTFISVF